MLRSLSRCGVAQLVLRLSLYESRPCIPCMLGTTKRFLPLSQITVSLTVLSYEYEDDAEQKVNENHVNLSFKGCVRLRRNKGGREDGKCLGAGLGP